MFNKFDTDKSGSIDSKEFQHLCFNLGYSLTDTELKLALKTLDDDSSGKIELREFTTWWKRADRWSELKLDDDELSKRQVAADTFNSFDSSKSGVLQSKDFDGFYQSLVNAKLTSKPKDRALADFDTNGDKKLSFAEYIEWLKRQGTLTVKLPTS
jgi:Ca2+-binding EF-hand superfamily protein